MKGMRGPRQPTKQERDDHDRTTSRSAVGARTGGNSKAGGHSSGDHDGERHKPNSSLDYAFLSIERATMGEAQRKREDEAVKAGHTPHLSIRRRRAFTLTR